jgi:hypothetical protein
MRIALVADQPSVMLKHEIRQLLERLRLPIEVRG